MGDLVVCLEFHFQISLSSSLPLGSTSVWVCHFIGYLARFVFMLRKMFLCHVLNDVICRVSEYIFQYATLMQLFQDDIVAW